MFWPVRLSHDSYLPRHIAAQTFNVGTFYDRVWLAPVRSRVPMASAQTDALGLNYKRQLLGCLVYMLRWRALQ